MALYVCLGFTPTVSFNFILITFRQYSLVVPAQFISVERFRLHAHYNFSSNEAEFKVETTFDEKWADCPFESYLNSEGAFSHVAVSNQVLEVEIELHVVTKLDV